MPGKGKPKRQSEKSEISLQITVSPALKLACDLLVFTG
jgi:hypothetical protein